MALLAPDELQRVEAAITAAEAHSAGELVVAVVGRSERYDLPRGLFAASATLAAALVLHCIRPQLDASFLLLAQAVGWVGAWAVCGRPWLLRRLAGAATIDQAVQRRAQQMFTEQGIFRTRDQSGLLIMISVLERRVVLLGDSGIDARIGQDGWQGYVRTIVAGIRRGNTCGALLQVLQQLRGILATHFPQRPHDSNELPNKVIVVPS